MNEENNNLNKKNINTKSKNTKFCKTEMKIKNNYKGITLIALVVTIVVLLILAGVTLNLVIGNNGIITKAKDARIATRAGNAEDEVELWKSDNYIGKNTNGTTTSKEEMLQSLKDKNLVYEEEIDRANEVITIKNSDGTICKEIYYGGVIINISKDPETEKTSVVILTVTSVEGLQTMKPEEVENQIAQMDISTKKELIKNLYIDACNILYGTNFTLFEELLKYMHETGRITEETEEAFWIWFDTPESEYDSVILDMIGSFYYDEETGEIIPYDIINPDNIVSDTYIATENGSYTFKVKNLITNKIYTKTVEVTNIDKNMEYYVSNARDSELSERIWEDSEVKSLTKMASLEGIKVSVTDYINYYNIVLKEKGTDRCTTFSQAYIVYNNEKIDISECIHSRETENALYGWDVIKYMMDNYNVNYNDIEKTNQLFILVKDGVEYRGFAYIEKLQMGG